VIVTRATAMSHLLTIDRISGSEGTSVILALRGELDILGAARLRQYLAAVTAPELLIGLEDLDFLDSSGLAVLLEAKRERPDLQFRGARGDVRRVLERTGTLAYIES
jgi:anti-anti-sigma factor